MDTLHIANTGNTPLGDIWIAASERGLVAIQFPGGQDEFTAWLQKRHACDVIYAPQKLADAVEQMRAYANGTLREFSLPVDWSVLTPFQRRALEVTFAIPYGETRTYQEIAAQLGNPRAARAVGRAQATNPLPILIPCHRVLGKDNKLHGYGAGEGLKTKDWLLRMEEGLK